MHIHALNILKNDEAFSSVGPLLHTKKRTRTWRLGRPPALCCVEAWFTLPGVACALVLLMSNLPPLLVGAVLMPARVNEKCVHLILGVH